MCEVLAVAWPEPEPFGDRVLPWARELERLGVAGFGWGVAWTDEAGRVRVHKRPVRLADDPGGATEVAGVRSRRFLVHLRRPSRLSTVQQADTQPFVDDAGRLAFCHNGNLARHGELRAGYAGRLHGAADSEVGFVLFQDLLDGGLPAEAALPEVHRRLEGEANLGCLSGAGELLVYGGHAGNPFWSFRLGDATVATTSLHSGDESVFEMIFPRATGRERVEGIRRLAGALALKS